MQEAVRVIASTEFMCGALAMFFAMLVFHIYARGLTMQADLISAEHGTPIKQLDGKFYYLVEESEYLELKLPTLQSAPLVASES